MNNEIFIRSFVEIFNEFEEIDVYDSSKFIENTLGCITKLLSNYNISPLNRIIILTSISRGVNNEIVKEDLSFKIDMIVETFLP